MYRLLHMPRLDMDVPVPETSFWDKIIVAVVIGLFLYVIWRAGIRSLRAENRVLLWGLIIAIPLIIYGAWQLGML
jgi:hypothetical protein